jgi:hypothetical protein
VNAQQPSLSPPTRARHRGHTLVLAMLFIAVLTALGIAAVIGARAHNEAAALARDTAALRRCADFGLTRLTAAMPFPEDVAAEQQVDEGYVVRAGHFEAGRTGIGSLSEGFLASAGRQTYRNLTNSPQSELGAPQGVVGRRLNTVCLGPSGVQHESEAAVLYEAR